MASFARRVASVITSPANPAVKQIRALRERKERDRSGLCFIEGIRLVAEAVQLGAPVQQLVVAPELLSSDFAHEMVQSQRAAGVGVMEVGGAVFESLSRKEGPQGLGAVVRQQWLPLDAARADVGLCWVALDAVADPGNLGTILRTCDAVGAAGAILLGATSDPYDPAALRGSMGAVFSQRLVRAPFDAFIAWARSQRCAVIGTSDQATADLRAFPFPRPLALLMGSERQGLSPAQQAQCDAVVSIPMRGRSDSLNLAVATGVALYEIFYQHARV
ncbi:MAG: RNA methyltransferase [Chloroflexales bacterium]|nr:RNA methyltransferase [Chloroflexales bacterium]